MLPIKARGLSLCIGRTEGAIGNQPLGGRLPARDGGVDVPLSGKGEGDWRRVGTDGGRA